MSRSAWLVSAAALGSVAGLPWVFILQGPLISALFAGLAAFRADQLWQRPKARALSWQLVTLAVASAIALGHPASSTWPDHCFELLITNGKPFPSVLAVWALSGATALFCLASVEFALRRRLHALAWPHADRTSTLGSLWVGLAGLAWSVANETLLPNFPLMLFSIVNGEPWSFPEDPFRNPCSPEVGWVGAALYVLSLGLLWRSRKAARLSSARSSWLLTAPRGQAVVLAALLAMQGARTLTLFKIELPMLKQHGGEVDCGCYKYNHGTSAVIR